MDDDTKAQCVVRLGDGGFNLSGPTQGQSHHFFVPLTAHGLPYLDRANKVNLQLFPLISYAREANCVYFACAVRMPTILLEYLRYLRLLRLHKCTFRTLGVQQPLVFAFCDNSMCKKDWRCRKRETQAT